MINYTAGRERLTAAAAACQQVTTCRPCSGGAKDLRREAPAARYCGLVSADYAPGGWGRRGRRRRRGGVRQPAEPAAWNPRRRPAAAPPPRRLQLNPSSLRWRFFFS